MHRGYTPSYQNTNTPNGQVNALLGRIEGLYKQNELQLLIYLLQLSLQNFGESLVRLRLPKPLHDENLSSTIYEKLLAVKAKNHELTIRLLNLQAGLAKQNLNHRKTPH
jgi:hypothetical protein